MPSVFAYAHPDVLYPVFRTSDWTLRDKVVVALVCRHWRAIALHGATSLWANVLFVWPKPDSLELLPLTLERAGQNLLNISAPHTHRRDKCDELVLLEVGKRFCNLLMPRTARLRELNISLSGFMPAFTRLLADGQHFPQLISLVLSNIPEPAQTLVITAPVLQVLSLTSELEHGHLPSGWSGLLGPSLRRVTLSGRVELDEYVLLCAHLTGPYSGVVDLELVGFIEEGPSLRRRVWELCTPAEGVNVPPLGLGTVHHFRVHESVLRYAVKLHALAHVQHVAVFSSWSNLLDEVIGMIFTLHNVTYLRIHPRRDMRVEGVGVCRDGTECLMVREVELEQGMRENETAPVLTALWRRFHGLSARLATLVQLEVPWQLWGELMELCQHEELDARGLVVRLTVVGEERVDWNPSLRVRCPRLARLELHGTSRARLSYNTVLRLVQTIDVAGCPTVRLVVRRIAVRGKVGIPEQNAQFLEYILYRAMCTSWVVDISN